MVLGVQATVRDFGQGWGWGSKAVLSDGSLGAAGAAGQQGAFCQGHQQRFLVVRTRVSKEERRSWGLVGT